MAEPAPHFPKGEERKLVLLLSCLAAIRVFVFSAAFPFFNTADEQAHFDLTVKYSHGHLPSSLEHFSTGSLNYIIPYGSLEYRNRPADYPGGKFPPPVWTWSLKNPQNRQTLFNTFAIWQTLVNQECSQPPAYYVLTALWWHIGQWLGFEGGRRLYWLRFLNILFVVGLVWAGYAAARLIFPENIFLRVGVPALLACLPQMTFYSINNDVLSPLSFGLAFICLVRMWQADTLAPRLGMATGLALALTFLTKISNLPLLVVAGAFLALKIFRLARAGKLRSSVPALVTLAACAALPAVAWMTWCKINFGDFTGSAQKIHSLGWTYKSLPEWFHHPLFTPQGFWIFSHDLLATFWQGDVLWHNRPLALPVVDTTYVFLTFIFVTVALVNLFPKSINVSKFQRGTLWFGFTCFIASVVFLGFLSIIFDFHNCFYPSRQFPYFATGRLLLGALIPFLLLFVFGVDRALNWLGNRVKFLALGGIMLFMLVSQVVVAWPVFASQYNWFHL